MVKTTITTQKGVESRAGAGFEIEGKEYHEAPFDDRWDDHIAVAHEGTGPAALTYEAYRDTGFFMRFFRHNQRDNIFMVYQMPHEWNNGAIRPHMHCIPMASGSGTVALDYAFTWSRVGGQLSGSAGWTSGSMTHSFTPADQYNQTIVNFGLHTPPAGCAVDSVIFVIKVERNTTDDSYETDKDHGTPAANLALVSFDLHYQKSKAGSTTEAPEIA